MVDFSAVTDDIRKAVRIEMVKRDLTRDAVAELAGVTPEHVSRMLNARSGDLPDSWKALLKALGLRLIVVPDDDA